MNWGRDSTQV